MVKHVTIAVISEVKMLKFFVGLIAGLITIVLGAVLQNTTLVILGLIGAIVNIIQVHRKDL